MFISFTDLRTKIINHILTMKKHDPDYARYALKKYDALMPEFELMDGIREALKETK